MLEQSSYNSNIKIGVLLFLLILFISIFCVYYVDNLRYQSYFFIFINLIFLLKYPIRNLIKFYRFWYKKIFLYVLFYIIAGAIYIKYGTVNPLNTYEYWHHITLRTVIILLNTVLFTEILIKQISVSDLFRLKLSTYLKMRLIMFISIYNYLKTQDLLSLEILNIIPDYQYHENQGFIDKIKFGFNKNLVVVLALIYMVQDKSYILGKLIENRFLHLNNYKYGYE